MHKIHIDTDIGGDIDDFFALVYLLMRKDVEITGITTVAEDAGRRAGYVSEVLKIHGRDNIKVRAGADVKCGYFKYHPGYPDEVKMWGKTVERVENSEEDALESLKDSINGNSTIVCIGQYTNLRLLDEKYPHIIEKAHIYLMGGYIWKPKEGYPQWDNSMDYNIQLDPKSARYVFENSNPIIVPFPLALETYITHRDLRSLEVLGELGSLMIRQALLHDEDWKNSNTLGSKYPELPSDIINFQYDPLTCAIATGWDEIKISNVPLVFEEKDGALVEKIDRSGKTLRVVTTVDGTLFNKHWLDTVTETVNK